MVVSPINNQAQAEAVKHPETSPKSTVQPDVLALCAILLQETVNSRTQSAAQDEKELASKAGNMKGLMDEMRGLPNINIVFETDVTDKHAHKVHLHTRYGWTYMIKTEYTYTYKRLNQLTGAQCQQKLKRRESEREAISNDFADAQLACSGPETELDTDTNNIEQAQQQGVDLLLKLQTLTFTANMTTGK